MTANVKIITSARWGNGEPSASVGGIARAAAKDMPPRTPTQDNKIASGLPWLRPDDCRWRLRSRDQVVDTKTQPMRAKITVALTAMPPPISNHGFCDHNGVPTVRS